jgi:hypothetical protein
MNNEKVEIIKEKLKEIEIIALKIKAIQFDSLQTFETIHDSFEEGEIYEIRGVGYIIITIKKDVKVNFIIIMKSGGIWEKHWQDVDKILHIKQGIYYDIITKKEFKDKVYVKAFEPSYFKAIGEDDLIIKGEVYKT